MKSLLQRKIVLVSLALMAVAVVGLLVARQNKYYVKKFIKSNEVLYGVAREVAEFKSGMSEKWFGGGSADKAVRTPIKKRDWKLRFDASQSLGKYKRFWGNLGFESFITATRTSRGKELLQMISETNARVGETFRYIRAHNLYSNGEPPWGEGLDIYHEDSAGRLSLKWEVADSVFDTILRHGLKPIVEFGFMPDKLASIPDRRQQWGKANISPPKDYEKWYQLVFETVAHFRKRYGEDELETWYFEVWNEPDLGWLFWVEDPKRKPYGDTAEYFKLYDVTVEAAKRACPSIRIGGPASAGGDIDLLLEHIFLESESSLKDLPRIDFVSTHAYGKVGFDYRQNMKKGIMGAINWKIGRAAQHDHPTVREELESLEFLLTETGPKVKNNLIFNTRYLAAWLIKMVDGVLYLGDELGRAFQPDEIVYWAGNQVVRYFGTGKGIAGWVKFQGRSELIKRPAFNAFEALGHLGNERIKLVDGPAFGDLVHAIGTKDGDNSVEVLVYQIDEDSRLATELDSARITLEVENLPFASYQVEMYLIDETHANAYSLWQEMGKPKRIDAEQRRRLLQRHSLKVNRQWRSKQGTRSLKHDFVLQNNSVVLFRIVNDAA